MDGVSDESSWSEEKNRTETNTFWVAQVEKKTAQSRKIMQISCKNCLTTKIEVTQKIKSISKNVSVIFFRVLNPYSCFHVAIKTFSILPNTQKHNNLTGYCRKEESHLEYNFHTVPFERSQNHHIWDELTQKNCLITSILFSPMWKTVLPTQELLEVAGAYICKTIWKCEKSRP